MEKSIFDDLPLEGSELQEKYERAKQREVEAARQFQAIMSGGPFGSLNLSALNEAAENLSIAERARADAAAEWCYYCVALATGQTTRRVGRRCAA